MFSQIHILNVWKNKLRYTRTEYHVAKKLLIICCSNWYEYSIQTGDWDITDNIKFVISKSLHFSGHVSNEYTLEKLRQINSAEILANVSVKLEEKLDNIPDVPKESLLGKQKNGISADYMVDSWPKFTWRGLSKYSFQENMSLGNVCIGTWQQTTCRVICLMPIAKNHNLQEYCFFIVQLSTGPQVMKLIFLEGNWKTITLPLSSDQNIKLRAILFVENEALVVLNVIRRSKLLAG